MRMLLSWKAIEPRTNHDLDQILLEGEKYLKLVQQIIDELYAHNLLIYPDGKRDIEVNKLPKEIKDVSPLI